MPRDLLAVGPMASLLNSSVDWTSPTWSIATSTRKAYQLGANHFFRFCFSLSVSPFPACEHTLSLSVARLYADGLCSATVKTYLESMPR